MQRRLLSWLRSVNGFASLIPPLLLAVLLAACGEEDAPRLLGPHDGRGLTAADTGRVGVGDEAPDFTLESYAHGVVTLSDYRGSKEVVLVFYRGHW
jgi:hypothetical protein